MDVRLFGQRLEVDLQRLRKPSGREHWSRESVLPQGLEEMLIASSLGGDDLHGKLSHLLSSLRESFMHNLSIFGAHEKE
jgi:hypothetical protein